MKGIERPLSKASLNHPKIKGEILIRMDALYPGKKSHWGSMNVAQMLAHCRLVLRTAMGKQKVSRHWTSYFFGSKWKSLYYDNAPFERGSVTHRVWRVDYDCDFETERKELASLILRFHPDQIPSHLSHPFSGRLTREQWCRGLYKHLDHHLKQFGV